MKVMIVGNLGPGRLESSYGSAFAELGHQVVSFDIDAVNRKYARFGKIGGKFNNFVPVYAWVNKANRDLVAQVIDEKIDILIVTGFYQAQAGALAQIKTSSRAKLVNLWPDTFVNLKDHTIMAFPLYDLVATYSSTGVAVLQLLGARRARWVPLAGDPLLHPVSEANQQERQELGADVTFIGGWRPEREALLQSVIESGVAEVKIWGPEWNRQGRGRNAVLKAWQGRALVGEEFSKAVRASKINLNIIDPTNYPAANMRFFEVPIAGGLQLSSACPEMENVFRHGEHLFYFRDADDLTKLIRELLTDDKRRLEVTQKAQQLAQASHTYKARAQQILDLLGEAQESFAVH